jgi:hypothetical protein
VITALATRPAEGGLLELEDTADPLPLWPPWKKDAKSEQDYQGHAAGLARTDNCQFNLIILILIKFPTNKYLIYLQLITNFFQIVTNFNITKPNCFVSKPNCFVSEISSV